tara:strand:+ start:7408 stop:7809 length:402 start_codon:yes stop_codon:yes gene_type:complete
MATTSKHEYPLKDYLNSINLKQGDLSGDERAMKKYPAYVINKCLSSFIDTVMHANEMNASSHLDNDLQYQYFIHSVRKSKRFSPWDKKSKDCDLDLVKQYYGYNNEKAQQAMRILTKEQLDVIKLKLNTGGRK